MIDSICRRNLFPEGLWPLDQPYIIHINIDSLRILEAAHMPHLHLQIQFGSDFEGYAAGAIPPCLSPSSHLPSFILASSYTWNIMQIFVRSECDYVGVEMSVGMFATPLTLSAAALSWIPWLNFNRYSTMRIRQGDLAVLFHCVVRYACIMRMSLCTFVF